MTALLTTVWLSAPFEKNSVVEGSVAAVVCA